MAKNPKVKPADDDEPKAMRVRTIDTEADADTEAPEVVETEEAPTPVQSTQASLRKGWVRFNCFVDVEPAPVVGTFSFAHDCNIMKLESKKVYSCPQSVAEHLVDKKVGIIIPD